MQLTPDTVVVVHRLFVGDADVTIRVNVLGRDLERTAPRDANARQLAMLQTLFFQKDGSPRGNAPSVKFGSLPAAAQQMLRTALG